MSVDKSKTSCLRCVVQLVLDKLEWKDSGGVSIHLKGMPVFLRACILGQLQHSKLHSPNFPLSLNQKLVFDRTLSNCRDPSLFKEVIRGEHVKIEVIQVTEDCKGGKILARYDVPTHEFLYPDDDSRGGQVRKVPLEKSRNYLNPPELHFSTSTLLVEATVQSPVRLLFPQSNSSDNTSSSTSLGSNIHPPNQDDLPPRPTSPTPNSKRYSSSRHRQSRASRKLFDRKPEEDFSATRHSPQKPSKTAHVSFGSTRDKLDSILSKYEPSQVTGDPLTRVRPVKTRDKKEKSSKVVAPCKEEQAMPKKIKFKPDIPRFSEPPRSPPNRDLSPYHMSRGRLKGPHEWPECPHRSPERPQASPKPLRSSRPKSRGKVQSRSVPQSPIPSLRLPSSPYHQRCVTVPQDLLLSSERSRLSSGKAAKADGRPPFKVRHIDESLMGKRNFCGVVNGDRPSSSSSKMPGVMSIYGESEDALPPTRVTPSPLLLPSAHQSRLQTSHHEPDHISYSPISSISPSSSSSSSSTSSSSSSSSNLTDIPNHLRPSPVAPRPIGKDHLVAKYLTASKGNVKPRGRSRSPDTTVWTATAICNRLDRLRERCCECLHSADSLGEDNLSEDLERLRDSLQGERDEALDRSSRLVPDESVLVKLGPRDYWSKRMAEFTGKRHRVLFDETLEKIYNRLYTKASLTD